MRLSDFDYHLPAHLIAQAPLPGRAQSRLLHVDSVHGSLVDRKFAQLPDLVRAGDLLVLNDTRVINARLTGFKASGGRVEVLVERVLDAHHALVQMRASKTPHSGSVLTLADGAVHAVVQEREGEFFRLRFEGERELLDLLERFGSVPLPPYIEHAPDLADAQRYQTVYAREPGAVAAPTAGLHFDQAMLDRLRSAGVAIAHVTLHVGAGTFQPVRVESIAQHVMHREAYHVSESTVTAIDTTRAHGGRVLAVGTTSLRALESAAASGSLQPVSGETGLFITPGYRFRVVDRLLTNFHLPKSTLLMLVSAFGGVELTRRAYAHAVARQYRFFSYGDAMLVERADTPG